jgi:signal transduction histidine kinase/ActR/RegA family two-component response regulator
LVDLADEAIASALPLLAGTWKVVEVMTFAALIYLRAWPNATADKRIRYEQAAFRMLDELRRLSSSCRANLEHKVLLVEAELARVRGLFDEAAELYQRAVDAAALEGFRLYEALANELAGRFWKERGLTTVARAYLREAHARYAAWGAKAKVDSLVEELGDLVSPAPHAAARVPDSRTGGDAKRFEAEPLDFLSVAKAWQAISSEIERDRLIDKLMRIIVESAGAQRGALLLKLDGQLRVVATAENGGENIKTATAASIGASRLVTDSIVRYTARTGETVVLQDASAHGLFVGDVQVRERRLRSVLCAPIRVQDETVGVVYMENDLSAGAFTPSRAFVVELLAGQAAVSLENARLYADLRAAMSNVEAARRDAEAANRTKDEFLAMLGHELRNPLAPILTALQLMHLRGSNLFEKERAIIDRQVKHMVRLVDDLLEVSRITGGKISLESVPVDLGEALAQAVEMVSPLFDQRLHHLTTDVESGLTARGDRARLAQVFSNLLTNAAKYTPLRGRVAIRAWRDGSDAVVSVKDTGIGIAREMLPKIFDLFVQERQSIDRSRGGLGLGLALVRSLVGMHGGRVEAQSAGTNQGSEFIIRLPAMTQSPDHAGAPIPVRAPRISPVHDLCRILVVDDNEDAAETMAEALRELGHEVRTAQDGGAALVCLESFTPEVAILDIGLPVMDGYELARQIRLQERLAGTRLIALTGYGQVADKVRAHEAGFDVHLVKPVELDVLVALVSAPKPGARPAG